MLVRKEGSLLATQASLKKEICVRSVRALVRVRVCLVVRVRVCVCARVRARGAAHSLLVGTRRPDLPHQSAVCVCAYTRLCVRVRAEDGRACVRACHTSSPKNACPSERVSATTCTYTYGWVGGSAQTHMHTSMHACVQESERERERE